jgi:hypothetical protein
MNGVMMVKWWVWVDVNEVISAGAGWVLEVVQGINRGDSHTSRRGRKDRSMVAQQEHESQEHIRHRVFKPATVRRWLPVFVIVVVVIIAMSIMVLLGTVSPARGLDIVASLAL